MYNIGAQEVDGNGELIPSIIFRRNTFAGR